MLTFSHPVVGLHTLYYFELPLTVLLFAAVWCIVRFGQFDCHSIQLCLLGNVGPLTLSYMYLIGFMPKLLAYLTTAFSIHTAQLQLNAQIFLSTLSSQ